MTRVEVSMRTEVYPTESRKKVEAAVRNVLGDIALEYFDHGGSTVLEGRSNDLKALKHLRDLLRRARIRDAARALLSRSLNERALSFGLNKQAAFAGQVSFYRLGESALGPIQITVNGDVSEVINFLCGY